MVREIQVLFSPAISICLQFFLGFGSARAFPGRLKNLQNSSLGPLSLRCKDFSFRHSSPVCVHDLLAVTSSEGTLFNLEGVQDHLKQSPVISNKVLLHLVLLQVGTQQEWWHGGSGRGKPAWKNPTAVLALLENITAFFRSLGARFLGSWERPVSQFGCSWICV